MPSLHRRERAASATRRWLSLSLDWNNPVPGSCAKLFYPSAREGIELQVFRRWMKPRGQTQSGPDTSVRNASRARVRAGVPALLCGPD